MDVSPHQYLIRAIATLGSQAAMARLLGLAQPSIHLWVRSGKVLPAEHVLKVEAATGISRHLLRPDIYPVENGQSPPSGSRPGGAPAAALSSPGLAAGAIDGLETIPEHRAEARS